MYTKNRGSIIVDAAACIPIFVIAMGMILMLITECFIEADAVHALSEDISYVAFETGDFGEESVSKTLKTKIPIPKSFISEMHAFEKITYRPFYGESKKDLPYDTTRVFVFPKAGERYHSATCRILKEGGIETILTAAARIAYSACKLCHADELQNGSKIYIASLSGKVYHRKECSVIEKAYVSMPKTEAENEGYTPCLICGGGN